MAVKTNYQPRLKTAYFQTIRPKLRQDLKLANHHQVPQLTKIVISVGLGRLKDNKQIFETAHNTLAKITGQRAKTTKARKSIAGFKLRQGQTIGLLVTLRGDRMYEFLDRLINLVIPRLRDFRGNLVKSFDSQGHYSLGLRDQSVFPELSFEETNPQHGLQISFVIESPSKEASQALLTEFGMKFERQDSN